MQNNQGVGFLKIQALSAGGAFPVMDAVVIISDSEGKSIASLRTDSSGLTETISLSAPPRSLSQSPPNIPLQPYSTFTVQVSKDGYYPVEDYSVPVFDGITSIQRANMIPLSEFSPLPPNPRPQQIETPGYPNLQNNGGSSQ
ncbi:MAG: hypothetical protein IJF69_04885 [Clostridia bacterium]|nr:hypothetical protein [Clostridia bacterium]